MFGYRLSCEEHVAIYSAALPVLFRAVKEFASWLVGQVSHQVFRRLVIYCAGVCVFRKYQPGLGLARQVGGCSHEALNRLINSIPWTARQVMVLCFQTALTPASGTSPPVG